MIPADVPLRVVGDVHGDLVGLSWATRTDRFIVQLGDLTDYGPDSAGVLRLMFRLIDEGRGLFILGNHDHKLRRALLGNRVVIRPPLRATLDALDPELAAEAVARIAAAPAWLRRGPALFVHGGFHTDMLLSESPAAEGHATAAVSRALYGEPTGRTQDDGFPERSLAWIDRIPAGLTVYCGHDRRSTDGRPWRRRGTAGGEAVFLDTGAGKGGHLSWIDLDIHGQEETGASRAS